MSLRGSASTRAVRSLWIHVGRGEAWPGTRMARAVTSRAAACTLNQGEPAHVLDVTHEV
jgi:hypothetical protein